MFGYGQGVDDIPVGQHHFHADALVVNFAVLGGHDSDSPVPERSADGPAGQAGGNVLAGISPFISVPLQLLENHAGFCGDRAADLIHFNQVVHALHIHHDSACHGQCATLRSRSAAPDIDRDFIVVGNFQDFGYFHAASRPDDPVGHGRLFAAIHPHAANPKVVHAIGRAVAFACRYIFNSNDIFQLCENHVAHKRFAFHPVLSSLPLP